MSELRGKSIKKETKTQQYTPCFVYVCLSTVWWLKEMFVAAAAVLARGKNCGRSRAYHGNIGFKVGIHPEWHSSSSQNFQHTIAQFKFGFANPFTAIFWEIGRNSSYIQWIGQWLSSSSRCWVRGSSPSNVKLPLLGPLCSRDAVLRLTLSSDSLNCKQFNLL